MIPLQELQSYKAALEAHQAAMTQFFSLYKQGFMPLLETLSVKPLVDFHARLSKILKDNNIESFDNGLYQQKIADVVQSLAKVQT